MRRHTTLRIGRTIAIAWLACAAANGCATGNSTGEQPPNTFGSSSGVAVELDATTPSSGTSDEASQGDTSASGIEEMTGSGSVASGSASGSLSGSGTASGTMATTDGSVASGSASGGATESDSSADAAADTVDSGPADASSFTNPLQIDVKALLTFNTVVTTATGGVALTPVDGPNLGGRNFSTEAEAQALNDAGIGLPNTAFLPATGTTIPNVQLAWTNASNVGNSLVVPSNAGTSETFNIPEGNYSQLQIYVTGSNGSSTLNVTLTYASGNPLTANSTLTIPDWCLPGTLPAGVYTLASAQRVKKMMLDTTTTCSIYAIDLNPDPTRALTKVAFVAQGVSGQYVVFYGATAW
jgi:hypothetical protein